MGFLNDIYQYWGSDLSASPSGDLDAVEGSLRGQQRVLRRLLTNPGDDIFNPNYGAGLAQYVGSVASAANIESLIRGQMLQESVVSKSPPPQVAVTQINSGLQVSLSYTDAPTGQPVVLSFNVSA